MTTVHSILQRPITIPGEANLFDAISKLLHADISRLIVEEEAGKKIITEKDIGLFLLTNDSEKNLDEIPVSQIAKNITAVHEDMSIKDASQIMIDRGFGSLGVNSSEKGLVGLITKTDIIKYYFKNYVGHKRVGDLMTISYSSMKSDDSLDKIVKKMIEEKVSRIFLTKDNEPIGILTFRDLFHLSLDQGRSDTVMDNSDPAISVLFPRKGFLSESGFGGTTKGYEVMSKNIQSIDYNEDLVRACEMMIENKISGLAVKINEKISGVLSKTDIVNAITKIKE